MPRYGFDKKGKVKAQKPQPIKESRLQKNYIRWFDMQYSALKLNMFHIPNGGSRNPIEAAQFKYMGVRSGVADLFLAVAAECYNGMFLELKREGEKQSDNQKTFQKAVEKCGYLYVVADTIEAAIELTQNYLRTTKHYKPRWKDGRLFGLAE